jgi:hypothetical protein
MFFNELCGAAVSELFQPFGGEIPEQRATISEQRFAHESLCVVKREAAVTQARKRVANRGNRFIGQFGAENPRGQPRLKEPLPNVVQLCQAAKQIADGDHVMPSSSSSDHLDDLYPLFLTPAPEGAVLPEHTAHHLSSDDGR